MSGYHIFAHSWGAVIAEVFAARQPPGLVSLVLGGALANTKEYLAAQWDKEEGFLSKLPQIMQDKIKQVNKDQDYQDSDYLKIVDYLTQQYMVRTFPTPDCISYSFTVINEDIFTRMWGPSDYSVNPTSVLAELDLTESLQNIRVPVLLTNGRYDTMRGRVA